MKFLVFKNGQPVKRFRVFGGHLFGTDGTSIKRVNIAFQDGMVVCQKSNNDSAGLALLWTVEGFGRILLPTTCVPERTRPYCLNVEIARARLMQTISRQEEWSLFEQSEELDGISQQAQQLFIKSVQKINDPLAASKLADGSLRKAMIFSEKLAMTQAETLFKNRKKARGFSRGCLGCQVDLDRIQDENYIERLSTLSPFVLIPMNWAHIEPVKGQFDFAKVEQCIEVLARHRMILGAGPLLCFSKEYLPEWVIQGKGTFESVREAAYQFVMEVVSRYSRRIHRWFVVSSINAFNHFGFDVEQALEITRAANMAVKGINPRAFKIVEIDDPWGQYYANTQYSIAPTAYMDMLIQSGVSFDAFALKMRFGKDQSGMYIRDLMQISGILDYFALMGKPLFITGVEIPSQQGDGPFDGMVAGIWHRSWDNRRQALWLEQFCITALGRPTVEAVIYGNLADRPDSAIAHSGLLTETLEPKDSYRVLRKLRESVLNQ